MSVGIAGESGDRLRVVERADADHADLALEVAGDALHLVDLAATGRAPGRPEPEQHRPARPGSRREVRPSTVVAREISVSGTLIFLAGAEVAAGVLTEGCVLVGVAGPSVDTDGTADEAVGGAASGVAGDAHPASSSTATTAATRCR